jgi:hypothetical protein
MKLILLLLVAVLAGAIIYPRYAEQTDTVCSAFEHKFAAVAALQARRPGQAAPQGLLEFLHDAVAGSQGQLAVAYIHERYPQLPPFIGCAVGYWRLSFDPDIAPVLRGIIKESK